MMKTDDEALKITMKLNERIVWLDALVIGEKSSSLDDFGRNLAYELD